MKSWIRPLITILLVLAILCVCISHRDAELLATALRAAQAALAVILGVIFFARLMPSWLSESILPTGTVVSVIQQHTSHKPSAFAILIC
ncbi:MAG TPA: hypothetical protein VG897_04125 [Terriglobales bacterium]|nr:hypothetical protein [Terriglobales bacterium]